MSWSDYGIPGTLDLRLWMEGLTAAANERYMNFTDGRRDPKPLEPPAHLASNWRPWMGEMKTRAIARGDFANMSEFDPYRVTDVPINSWSVPQFSDRQILLDHLKETDYDLKQKLNPKFDRRYFGQQYRMLNELTVLFPKVGGQRGSSGSYYDDFYGGKIRKRVVTNRVDATSARSGFRAANHAPTSYENADWFGYQQPGTNVGTSYYYDKNMWNPDTPNCALQFFQIVIETVWTLEADITAWFYPLIAEDHGYKNSRWLDPWTRTARLKDGKAEIEVVTPAIYDGIISQLTSKDDYIGIATLGCFFDFKTENGFQFVEE